jgi:hypothetical protein
MGSKAKTAPPHRRKTAYSRRRATPFDQWLERALKILNEAWSEPPSTRHNVVAEGHKKAHN